MFGYEFAVLRPALQPAVFGQSKHFGEPQNATNIFEAHTGIRECAARCPAAAIRHQHPGFQNRTNFFGVQSFRILEVQSVECTNSETSSSEWSTIVLGNVSSVQPTIAPRKEIRPPAGPKSTGEAGWVSSTAGCTAGCATGPHSLLAEPAGPALRMRILSEDKLKHKQRSARSPDGILLSKYKIEGKNHQVIILKFGKRLSNLSNCGQHCW